MELKSHLRLIVSIIAAVGLTITTLFVAMWLLSEVTTWAGDVSTYWLRVVGIGTPLISCLIGLAAYLFGRRRHPSRYQL